MRFNQKALYALAEKCEEGFDREGVLFIKEYTGLFRRRNYVQRWFKLKGNILFYLKTQEKTSIPVGALLLENCRVRIDPSNEKSPFAFVLLFESDSSPCSFFCLSDKDRQEWVAALKRASYEDLRVTLFDLRSKLMDLTGEDPLVEDSCSFSPPKDPIEDKSSKPSSSLSLIDEPLGFSIPDVSPVLELSLSCRDLFHPSGIIHFNTFCVLSTMTPPQSAWSKHAQTEVAESNRNPQYFTNVTFFAGNISMITQIKVSVYYVKEKGVDSATPLLLGNTQFTVSDIVTAKQQKVERLLKLRGCSTSTGSVTVQAWKMVESPESVRRFTSPLRTSTVRNSLLEFSSGTPRTLTSTGEAKHRDVSDLNISHRQSVRKQFDNSITRSYRFPTKGGLSFLKVWETMGEGQYTWTVPIQLLKLFIEEEKQRVAELQDLVNLCDDWKQSRDQILQDHTNMVTYYSDMVSDLENNTEMNFKSSVAKAAPELEFVATNQHIQRMKVMADKKPDKTFVYDVVTIGAPAAHSLRFKQGGLRRLLFLPKDLNGSSSTEIRHLMQSTEALKTSIDSAKLSLLGAAELCLEPQLRQAMQILKEKVGQLCILCEAELIKTGSQVGTAAFNMSDEDRLKESGNDWVFNGESYIRVPLEWHIEALCQKLEQLCVWLESKVDALCQVNEGIEVSWYKCISIVVKELTLQVDLIMKHIMLCLNFLLLKEESQWSSIGLMGPRHRRDIVLTQAVSGLVTCFILHLKEHLVKSMFMQQLSHLGFLAHWESLLSTHGEEMGMLEDCSAAIDELNKTVVFKLIMSEDNEMPVITGTRSNLEISIPLKPTKFQLIPQELQQGRPIRVCVILFTQGINEQQSFADRFGDAGIQHVINIESMSRLETYYESYRDLLTLRSSRVSRDIPDLARKVEQLRTNVNSRRTKNVDILILSAEVCRKLNGGRLTSCKSAKDRSAMSVTLEMCSILQKEHNLHPAAFEQALDTIRSQGTRLINAEKNVGERKFAFNALQVKALPKQYRPPEGTYKVLQS